MDNARRAAGAPRVVATSDDEEAVGVVSEDEVQVSRKRLHRWGTRARKRGRREVGEGVGLEGAGHRPVPQAPGASQGSLDASQMPQDASQASQVSQVAHAPATPAPRPPPATPPALDPLPALSPGPTHYPLEQHTSPPSAMHTAQSIDTPSTGPSRHASSGPLRPTLPDTRSPPRRNLRRRKLAQIRPYTVEALQYRRELYQNDWQDAVVSQREWQRHALLRAELPETQSSAPDVASEGERERSPSLTASPRVRRPSPRRRPTPTSSPEPEAPPRRVPPRSPSPASEDSTDYERRFRVLKRMMPAHMARACIDDLRAMRHGHAAPSESESSEDERPAPSNSPLRPGESRRRRGAHIDAHAPLLSDVESSSDGSEEERAPSPVLENTDVRWWCRSPRARSPPAHEEDAVDRMLARTSGARGFGQRTNKKKGSGRAKKVSTEWLWGNPSGKKVRSAHGTPRAGALGTPGAHGARHAPEWAPRNGSAPRPPNTQQPSSTPRPSSTQRPSSVPRLGAGPPGALPDSGAASSDDERTSVFLLPGQPDRFLGVPTTRGDLRAFARLPYTPGATRNLPGDDEMLMRVPLDTLSTRPKSVPRHELTAAPSKGAVPATPAPALPALPTAWQHAILDTPELQTELQDLLSFDQLANVSLDFGLHPPPPGVRFAPHTNLAKGKLHALLRARERDVRHDEAPVCHVFGHTLRGWLGMAELEQVLPALLDQAWEAMEEGSIRPLRDLLAFLGEWISWQSAQAASIDLVDLDGLAPDTPSPDLASMAARLFALVYTLLERAPSDARALRLALLWFRVEVVWRTHNACAASDVDVLEAAQPLVVHLLADGVHRCMNKLRDETVDDDAAELWISLMHLLHTLDTPDRPPAFYDVLEAALDDWHESAPASHIVWSERVWYVVLAMHSLAHFGAAAGVARTTPVMSPTWTLVQRALALRLRFSAPVECAAPRALLRRRDAYIRIVVCRCLLLHEQYDFSLVDAESVLGRLFDVFDQHRLADLPSESDHDFAPFLRRYDIGRLLHGPPDANAYHVFLQLLGRAGAALAERDALQGTHRAARLFSRMTPVRVMPFTEANVPTSAERAMLFNHYSIVMLFLYFVPSSAVQRLRQIRSFLAFAGADKVSQVTCVRAMVYCGTLFRHHGLGIAPVVAWFVDVCRAAAAEVRAAPLVDAPFAERRQAHAQKEAARILLGVVRGVQHVVQHASLAKQAPVYPPPELLHAAWTDELLQTIADPSIEAEVVQGIRLFVQQRADVRPKEDDEFDDAFLNDPALAALLGEEAPPPPPAWDASRDRLVADALHARISPALFARLAHAPSEREVGGSTPHAQVEALVAHAEADERRAKLVECWAACAQVLVQNELRSWHSYLTLGAESWRRISDGVLKRDIALQFAVCMARLDPRAFREEAYEIVGIWFQSIAAPAVTLQPVLTALIVESGGLGLFRGVGAIWRGVEDSQPSPSHPSAAPPPSATPHLGTPLSLSTPLPPLPPKTFAMRRAALLRCVLHNLNTSLGPVISAGYAIQCVSALLSSMRAYASTDTKPYLRTLLPHLHGLSAVLQRGIATELHATSVVCNE